MKKLNPEAKPKENPTDLDRWLYGDPYAKAFPWLRYDGWVEPFEADKTLDGRTFGTIG